MASDNHANLRQRIDSGSKSGEASPPADPVDTALAEALTKAVTAGCWESAAKLARELETRRRARQSG